MDVSRVEEGWRLVGLKVSRVEEGVVVSWVEEGWRLVGLKRVWRLVGLNRGGG